MPVNPSPIGGFAGQFFDNNGVILSGGKIYTYAAGTTTPQATYTSASGATPHANPIILDSAGRVPGGEIWLTDGIQYKFVIETAGGLLIGTYDNVVTSPGVLDANDVSYTANFAGSVPQTAQTKLEQYISTDDFGAVGNGIVDDTAAIVAAINAAIGGTLQINPKTYSLASGMQTITLTDSITINCADATLLNNNASATTLIFEAQQLAAPVFLGTAARGASTINVASTAGVTKGSLVYINSTKIYETAYNYRQREVHKVLSITPTSITFSEPLVFSYDAATDGVTLSVRKDVSVTINGPLTLTYPASSGGTGRIIDLRYLSNSVINGARAIDPQRRKGSGPDVIFVGESYNTTFNDSYFSGARYSVNVSNGSRNTSFKNVESVDCWHPIDFNTAAYGCFVQNIRGQNNSGTIQSHPCFNLSYQDAYTEGDEYVLPRAVGVYIRNARIVTSFAMDSNGFNSDVNLVDDVYSEFDFVVKDYTLDAPNAIAIQTVVTNRAYRTAHFVNVDVGRIALGLLTPTECYVSDSYVATIICRGNALYASNTVIDASHRQSVGGEAHALSMANLKAVRFSNCDIRGGHQFLINNPVNAPQGITFSNCRIDGISTGMFSGVVVGLTSANILFSNCIGGNNTFNLAGTYVGGNLIKADNCVGLGALEHYKKGSFTGTTDSNGNINIPHGIYATPTWADVIVNGDNTFVAQVQSITSSNITVRLGNMASSGGDVISTAVSVFWEAAL